VFDIATRTSEFDCELNAKKIIVGIDVNMNCNHEITFDYPRQAVG